MMFLCLAQSFLPTAPHLTEPVLTNAFSSGSSLGYFLFTFYLQLPIWYLSSLVFFSSRGLLHFVGSAHFLLVFLRDHDFLVMLSLVASVHPRVLSI